MSVRPAIADRLRHFRRACKLTVYRTTTPVGEDFLVTQESNGIVITDLRVQFDITRDLSKHPNTGSVRITNLAENTRAALEQKPLSVVLEAGYDGLTRTLFKGDVVFGMSKLEHPNWTTMLQLGDGDRVTAGARLNRSYGSGATYKTVLRDALKSIGQTMPKNLEEARNLDAQLPTGGVMFGNLRDEMTRVLKPLGYTWSFQNGQFQAVQENETLADVYEVSEDTGMIGLPEFGTPLKSGKKPHVTITTLLYPELRPGGKAVIKARNMNGTFRIEAVKHTGDTHGTSWTTEIEVKPT